MFSLIVFQNLHFLDLESSFGCVAWCSGCPIYYGRLIEGNWVDRLDRNGVQPAN